MVSAAGFLYISGDVAVGMGVATRIAVKSWYGTDELFFVALVNCYRRGWTGCQSIWMY